MKKELDELKGLGHMKDDRRFMISARAHLIMPYHKKLDAAQGSREETEDRNDGTGDRTGLRRQGVENRNQGDRFS